MKEKEEMMKNKKKKTRIRRKKKGSLLLGYGKPCGAARKARVLAHCTSFPVSKVSHGWIDIISIKSRGSVCKAEFPTLDWDI